MVDADGDDDDGDDDDDDGDDDGDNNGNINSGRTDGAPKFVPLFSGFSGPPKKNHLPWHGRSQHDRSGSIKWKHRFESLQSNACI